MIWVLILYTRADPEGDRGSGPPPPLKNRKNVGFPRNIGPDPT